MTGKAAVYNNQVLAGILEKLAENDYVFRYDDAYFKDSSCLAISLSFSKKQQEYRSATLFPFFFGLLSEGVNKSMQCRLLRIDENDHFSLLIKTAHSDTIGAITIREVI